MGYSYTSLDPVLFNYVRADGAYCAWDWFAPKAGVPTFMEFSKSLKKLAVSKAGSEVSALIGVFAYDDDNKGAALNADGTVYEEPAVIEGDHPNAAGKAAAEADKEAAAVGAQAKVAGLETIVCAPPTIKGDAEVVRVENTEEAAPAVPVEAVERQEEVADAYITALVDSQDPGVALRAAIRAECAKTPEAYTAEEIDASWWTMNGMAEICVVADGCKNICKQEAEGELDEKLGDPENFDFDAIGEPAYSGEINDSGATGASMDMPMIDGAGATGADGNTAVTESDTDTMSKMSMGL